MKLHRIVSTPLSWIWATILRIRHSLYDGGVLKSFVPAVPTIVVGNLSFGGTGKTPHVLWLCEHFPEKQIAVLSRGHGRKTKGFLSVSADSNAKEVGDEPLFMSQVQPKVQFFVCEDRRLGIEKIMQQDPSIELIILDDAFQHRAVQSPMNMLLTTEANPYNKDCLVPCGRLRDLPSRASQSELIIVTKCESDPPIQQWKEALNLQNDQSLLFSKMSYGKPYELRKDGQRTVVTVPKTSPIVAISGIADARPFNEHIRGNHDSVAISEFKDHHDFSMSEIDASLLKISNFAQEQKWFVTTEKDAVRLLPFLDRINAADVKVAVLPIKVEFLHGQEQLEKLIRQHVG